MAKSSIKDRAVRSARATAVKATWGRHDDVQIMRARGASPQLPRTRGVDRVRERECVTRGATVSTGRVRPARVVQQVTP